MTSPSRQFVGPPAASPVQFDIDGATYELDDIPTRAWLEVLTYQRPACWLHIVPTRVAGDGSQQLAERILDDGDAFDLDDLERVAETVISQACGTDFEAACKLAGIAYSNWQLFDGWAASRGWDPLAEPIPRVLAAVYAWRRSMCHEKGDLPKLDSEVWVMPPATTVSGRPRNAEPQGWSDELEAQGFMAAMTTLSGQRRSRSGS